MDEQRKIGEKLARLQTIAPAGYALALHINFATPTFMFQTYPKTWRDEYGQNGYILCDPSVRWGFENTGIIAWSALTALDEHGVFAKAAHHNLKFGATVAVDTGSQKSMGGFARGDRAFDAGEESLLFSLTQELHDMTAHIRSLSPQTTQALKNLSVKVTNRQS